MQTLLRDPAAGLMHSLIYFGFLVLFVVTTVLEIDHQLPEQRSSSCTAASYQAYSFVGDLAGARVPRRHRLGDRAPLRPAARTASASRPSPSTR